MMAIIERKTPNGARAQLLNGPLVFLSSSILPSFFQEGDTLFFANSAWSISTQQNHYYKILSKHLSDDLFI